MKTTMKRLLMACLLAAGIASAASGQQVMQMGITQDNVCKYGLYYSYFTYNGFTFGESYYATINDFVNTSTWVTVPATVEYGGRVYQVRGISDSQDIGVSLTEHNIYSLTFEGDVTMWGSPINVKGGMTGFSTLRFKGRSFPFDGDVSNYITCTSLNNLTVYLSDKNEQQIAELRQTAPWNQFYNVQYSPIHLSLTTESRYVRKATTTRTWHFIT